MKQNTREGRASAAVLLLVAAGCAGATPPPPSSPPLSAEPAISSSGLLGVPVGEAVVTEEVSIRREPDQAPRDRWESPFAVSAEGRVVPVDRRRVVVVDADPAIAAGVAEQEAVELDRPAPRREASPPRRTAPPAAPPARAIRTSDEATRLHLVQRGDTWYGIANRYRVPSRALAEANPDVDPERIRIGQTLVIPRTD